MARRLLLFALLLSTSLPLLFVSADQHISVASGNTTIEISPSLLVENSPGSKPGSKMYCERLQIHGFSRLKQLKKFPNSVKIKVLHDHPSGHKSSIEVCFHRNMTLGVGMCPQGQWEKLTKDWVKSMSPFDHMILDVRMASATTDSLQVSIDEEVFLYRVVFLVLGIIMLTVASSVSQSVVFYYGGAMTIGVMLVVLIVLFQGMKLLPTGRKNALAFVLYSSIVGVGTFLLHNLPSLLQGLLSEIGIGEDLYTPLVMFLLVFLVMAGAWLGFWFVRKFILTEDGDIDDGVAQFMTWSMRIVATGMILQSSLDPLLAGEALLGGILISAASPTKFIHRIYRRLCRLRKLKQRKFHDPHTSPVQDLRNPKSINISPLHYRGSTSKSASQLLESEPFYSTYHETPERKKFSKDEWDKFTKESTKRALEGLVSSPDFGRWAAAHADRLTLAPKEDVTKSETRRRWFSLF